MSATVYDSLRETVGTRRFASEPDVIDPSLQHFTGQESASTAMADMDAPMGRGSQVIKVVLPTYIMAPTEDERFRRKKTCHIIADCLKKELEGKEFDEGDAKAWSASIADAVKARIHAECSAARYKIVVQTFVGQQRLQDVRITSRCLWDNDHDNHASAVFNSQYIWATCIVFGFYAD